MKIILRAIAGTVLLCAIASAAVPQNVPGPIPPPWVKNVPGPIPPPWVK